MTSMDEKYYSIEQATQILNKTRATIYDYIGRGLIQAYKPAGEVKLNKNDVDNFYENHPVTPKKLQEANGS